MEIVAMERRLTEDQRRWVEENIGIAGQVAKKHHGDLAYDDAINAAMWGLIYAVQSYDPSKNVKRSTHAWHTCYWFIKRRIRENRWESMNGVPYSLKMINFSDFRRDEDDRFDPADPLSTRRETFDVDVVSDIINGLPELYADIIRMILKGISFAEIRELTGYPHQELRNIKDRAMHMLKKAIVSRFGEVAVNFRVPY